MWGAGVCRFEVSHWVRGVRHPPIPMRAAGRTRMAVPHDLCADNRTTSDRLQELRRA